KRTIYSPHTPRRLRCNERMIDHYDLHLVQDIGSGRASWPNTSVPLMRNPVIIGESSESRPRQTVRRAANGCRTTVEHVLVDHGRTDIVVTEQLLDGADVVAVREEVGGKAVPE